jgi:molecular chaperone DnaK
VHGTLKDLGDNITSDEKTAIETAVKAVETAIAGDDIPAITDSVEALTKSAEPLFKAYQAAEAAKSATVEPGAETNSETKADNVVDAEFTEVKKDAE